MTLNVVGNSWENTARYCRFKSDPADRLAAGFAEGFAEGFTRFFELALTPSRPWRMTGFLFLPAALAVFRAAGRLVFFIAFLLFLAK